MKKKVQLFLVAMLLPFLNSTAQAQTAYPECLFDTLLQTHLKQNPEFARSLKSFPYGVRQFRAENPHLKPYPKPMPAPPCEMCMTIDLTCFKTKYALPVLVHIVHLPTDNTIGQGSNISNDHVYQAIASLNRKFAGYGEPDPAVNTGIQFFLAPEGQDSNGIFRYVNTMSNHSYTDESALYHLIDSQYRNGKYINIFVINQLIYPNDVGGYASMPGMPYDMVVVARRQFGDYNACVGCDLANTSTGKTTAHEMGHYLGLYHTHNKGCDMQRPCDMGGDEICDTRPSNDKNANNCTDTSSCVSYPILKENIMSYTPQSCAKYFTFNQMERMHYTLEYKRPNLINIDWLIALNPDICLFSARFSLAGNIVCDTGTVYFTALPYTTTGVTYRWTLYDSTQNIVLDTFIVDHSAFYLSTFNSPLSAKGFYDTRLQVIYGSDTATEYMSRAIWVTDCQAALPHEGGNWFFGRFAGLLFSESGVRPSTDAYFRSPNSINSYEGCISLSDSMGNLLFYGGGFQYLPARGEIFNSNHTPINNGYPLAISGNGLQNSVAFPCPFDTGKMMILQNNATVKGKLSYTLLKKSVDGLYVLDTATVNTPILIPEINNGDSLIVGESLTAAPKCNSQDYWVAITILQNGDSLGYLTILSVDNNGIRLADTVLLYKTFYSPNHTLGLSDGYGYAKFSPDGTHLAVGKRVFSFDRFTGKLTNKYTLPVANPKDSYTFDSANFDVYGLSFSPNSRYLYWLGEDSVTREANIQRMDLSLADPVNHIQIIGQHPSNEYFHALQLGPDGKLYIANHGSSKIGVIHYPDKEWDNTSNPLGYNPYGVPLQIGSTGGTSTYGLPNMIDALRPNLVKDTIYYTIKDCHTVVFSTPACCRSNYLWIFGDGDTSQQKETVHIYSYADIYHVKLVLDGIDTINVQVPLFTPRITLRGPHELCNENQYEPYDAIDLDSFSSQYQLLWEVKDGSYSPDPSNPDGILPMFDFLPAQIKVTVYDPLNQCTASDSFTVVHVSKLIGNKINYGIPQIPLCPTANSFAISGTTPFADTIFNYAWYYSFNNEDWFEMTGEDEKDLSTQPALEKTTYFKRLLYPDECDNWSNVVKVLPVIQHNDIFLLVPLFDERVCDPHIGGTLITSLRSDTVIAYDDPQEYYYFKWQTSNNGLYGWTDIEPYQISIGHRGYDWWYSPRSLERRFADHEPYQFIRKIVTFSNSSISCYDTSNVVKIVNYNIDSLREIRYSASDSSIIHGEIPIEPDSLFNVIWQSSCNGFDWTDIEDGLNQDTLWNVQLHSGRFIRRKIIKLSYKGEEYCDSLFSNQLELNYFSKQPSIQTAQIGDIALFDFEFTSTQTYSVQWQKFDSLNQVWVDLEGETDVTLSVEVEKCNLNTLYRVKIVTDCATTYSDSVWIRNSSANSDFFLWMKDIPSDTAAEPHANLNDYFISPDISASNSVMTSYRWGVSYQILNKEVDLYVRVHNKGGDTSRGGKLYLYASLAGLNPEWDFHFTDKFRGVSIGPGLVLTNQIINPNPPFNFQTLGSPINFDGIAIPSIPPNGDTVLHYRWTNVPDQFVDYQLRLGGMNYTPSKRTILYYARIEECSESPFDMTIAEEWFNPPNLVQTAKHNIKNNARIAALNSHILPVGDVFVSPGNPEIVTDIFALDKVKMVVTSESTIANDIEMIVYFDDTLWAAFQSGGFVGHGYTLLQDGIFRVDSFNNVYWDNIDLGINSVGHAGFSLHYKAGADSSGNAVDAAFKVTLFEDNTEKGSFYLNTNYRLPGLTMASIMPKTNKKSLNKSNISDIKDGSEETLLSTNHTDLTSKRSFEMRVYPNPFSNELKVYVGEYEQDAKIMLHDLNGKVLFNQPISNNTQASGYQIGISTLGFAEGIYFIQYVSGNRQIVKKVVLIR